MNSGLKNLTAFLIVLFFTAAVLCSSMAAPGEALASISGCSHSGGAMEMMPCEHPSYLCGFDSMSNLVSRGAFGSARSSDSFKKLLSVAVGEASVDASSIRVPAIGSDCTNAFPTGSPKVSIRLLNSILNV
jgi:hypothetical protein